MNKFNNIVTIFLFAFISSCGQSSISFSVDTPNAWHLIETTNKYQERQVKIEEPIMDSSASFPRNVIIGIIHANELQGYIDAILTNCNNQQFFIKN